jgi:hypothetical protein
LPQKIPPLLRDATTQNVHHPNKMCPSNKFHSFTFLKQKTIHIKSQGLSKGFPLLLLHICLG